MGIREKAIQRFKIKTIKRAIKAKDSAEDFTRKLAAQATEQAPKTGNDEQSATGAVERVGQTSVPLLRDNRRRAYRQQLECCKRRCLRCDTEPSLRSVT